MTKLRFAAHPGDAPVPRRRTARRSGMRLVVVIVVALIGCSSREDACPGQITLYCSAEQRGLRCDYEPDGRPSMCECNGGTWTCTDCPGREFPADACAAGATCAVWGFEDSCACSCDASGKWSCSIDDPNPNFHCSF